MVEEDGTLFPHAPSFGPAFLERLAGRHLLHDPGVALTELIANCWDAGARRVDVMWPDELGDELQIADDGEGMSKDELLTRWYSLAYDRSEHQPNTINVLDSMRRVYGRNGVGRLAAFCFGEKYVISTVKEGTLTSAQVLRSTNPNRPFELRDLSSTATDEATGTKLLIPSACTHGLAAEEAVTHLSMRFLTDSTFAIRVNGKPVTLSGIPDEHLEDQVLTLERSGLDIPIILINTGDSDRTTRFHGFAFRVGNRFVGEPSWELPGIDDQVDGRRAMAKRLLFIVDVSELDECVLPDWTAMDPQETRVKELSESLSILAQRQIEHRTEQEIQETIRTVKTAVEETISRSAPSSRNRWSEFVQRVARNCPSIRDQDMVKVATILAQLELSQSKYGLLDTLAGVGADDLDALNEILRNWSIADARTVLDELQIRLKLLQQLKTRTQDLNADEVQELQPLFHQSLWILGPEYESIEFTSNRSMNTVIRELMGVQDTQGSRQRPDFVILPNGSAGCYAVPSFGDISDGDAGENGIAKVVILELKRAGIAIDDEHKNQCWRYVKELVGRGLLSEQTVVRCFALGSEVKPEESSPRKELNDRCVIQPMTYSTIILRAESRLFNLFDRLRDSPFMRESFQELQPKTLYDAAGGRAAPCRANDASRVEGTGLN